MADLIVLTTQPVTLTGNTNQSLWSAVEAPSCDMLDLELGVVATTGSMTGTLSIRLITGNQKAVDDASWVTVQTSSGQVVFADISLPSITVPYWTMAPKVVNMGFQRYLRWSLINWNSNGLTSVTFVIRGMARRYAGGRSYAGLAFPFPGETNAAREVVLTRMPGVKVPDYWAPDLRELSGMDYLRRSSAPFGPLPGK